MTRHMVMKVMAAGAVAVAAAALAGCGAVDVESAAASTSRGLVGIAMPTEDSERWIADGSNIDKQFQLLGYTTDLQYADNDAAVQNEQVQSMIDRGAKALVIGSVDGTQLKDVLEDAGAADIPVISYDRLIRGSDDVTYYASFDNYRVGVLQAQFVVEALGLKTSGGTDTLELFAGSADDNNAYFFFNGAMSVLRPYLKSGRLTVPSGATAFDEVSTYQWSGDRAQERMAKLLKAYPSGTVVDAVLSPYDGISRGVLAAFEDAGYGGGSRPLPYVTGQDAELASVKLVAAGTQGSTVYKDTRELAKVAVAMTDTVLKGGTPEINDTETYDNGLGVVPSFLLQPVGVDADNYERVLVDGGYYTADQLK